MQMVDSRAIGKCSDFSGEESDWPGWRFKFEAWVGMLMAERHTFALTWMIQAAEQSQTIDELTLGTDPRAMSGVLYGILVSLVKGKALTIARKGTRGWGLELWRQLVAEVRILSGPSCDSHVGWRFEPHLGPGETFP